MTTKPDTTEALAAEKREKLEWMSSAAQALAKLEAAEAKLRAVAALRDEWKSMDQFTEARPSLQLCERFRCGEKLDKALGATS